VAERGARSVHLVRTRSAHHLQDRPDHRTLAMNCEVTLTVDTVPTGRARGVPPSRLLGAALMILAGLLAGCGQPGGTQATPSPSASPTPTATPALASGGPCGTTSTPPRQYLHVIWIIMENKSYSSVIGSSSAPYETQLARQCASDTHWSDAGSQYNSLPSYIAMTTGQSGSILTPFTCDCDPSSSVSVTVDNIFRQVRTAGGSERSYAEGMSGNCSNSGTTYAAKHNPAVYMWGGADRTACQQDDIPMGSATAGAFIDALNGNTLPTYALVAPNLCNDTHDCGVSTGDQFLKTLVPQILSSQAYRSGKTAVFVVWDEDSPIPNIAVAPSVIPGTTASTAVNHYGLLRATEEMLGLPLLGNAARATSLRTVFHI
jgi:hypothetical protein